MKDKKPTGVYSVRINHKVLATIYQHYAKLGVRVESYSQLCRLAMEDFATVLINNKLAAEFENLSDAMATLSNLRQQAAHRHKLRRTTAEQIAMEEDARKTGFEQVTEDELKAIIEQVSNKD